MLKVYQAFLGIGGWGPGKIISQNYPMLNAILPYPSPEKPIHCLLLHRANLGCSPHLLTYWPIKGCLTHAIVATLPERGETALPVSPLRGAQGWADHTWE
jgi:hypothetical protein